MFLPPLVICTAGTNKRMASNFNSSSITLANELSEIKLIRRVLLEFGVFDETNDEIDRAITLAKVDAVQDKMDAMFYGQDSVSSRHENLKENK